MKVVKKIALRATYLAFIGICLVAYVGCSQYAQLVMGSVWELKECNGEQFPLNEEKNGGASTRHVYIAFDNEGQFYHIDIQKKSDNTVLEEKTIRRSFPYRMTKTQMKLYDTWYSYEKSSNTLTLDYPSNGCKYEKTQVYTVEEIARYVDNKGKLKD